MKIYQYILFGLVVGSISSNLMSNITITNKTKDRLYLKLKEGTHLFHYWGPVYSACFKKLNDAFSPGETRNNVPDRCQACFWNPQICINIDMRGLSNNVDSYVRSGFGFKKTNYRINKTKDNPLEFEITE